MPLGWLIKIGSRKLAKDNVNVSDSLTAADLSQLAGSAASGVIAGALLTRMRVNADVAATGTTVADAAQLLEGFTVVTGADATKGVKLPPTPVAGTIVLVKSTTAAVLKVWPDAAATINAIAANAHIPLASLVSCYFIAKSPTQWYTLPLLPS